ncbi:MAG: hypothetical protein KKF78_06755 [Candidatus Omnitrophica bacterium]|nr:hypothetical protein [Candidatus Omnitrophota bacterium]MBU1996838.1 hypothetical protein [Candidatus Omnitrophota bacterium]
MPISVFNENEIGILSSRGSKEISKLVILLLIFEASSGFEIFRSGFASDRTLRPLSKREPSLNECSTGVSEFKGVEINS